MADKELIFQFISSILVILGLIIGDKYLLIISIIPILIIILLWYKDNVSDPIKDMKKDIIELKKDLNTRREIEDIKIQMLKNEINKK